MESPLHKKEVEIERKQSGVELKLSSGMEYSGIMNHNVNNNNYKTEAITSSSSSVSKDSIFSPIKEKKFNIPSMSSSLKRLSNRLKRKNTIEKSLNLNNDNKISLDVNRYKENPEMFVLKFHNINSSTCKHALINNKGVGDAG